MNSFAKFEESLKTMANSPQNNSGLINATDKSNRISNNSSNGHTNHSFGSGNVKDMQGINSNSSQRSNMNTKRTGSIDNKDAVNPKRSGSIDNKDSKGLSI